MGLTEYEPGTAFPGVIGRTTDESSPAWPKPLRAAPGTPNVVVIVLDDTGFGQLGCYGSPIATPNLDALATGGLLYTNMHTTALCSPSRSCIITGRNHHANATAAVNEMATGYPGYNGQIPFENGFLSEMLLAHGYSTYLVGKYHLLPSEFESAAGPYDRWPLGRGFERFYGFLGGDTSQWHPDLVYDNHQVKPPRTPEQGYHLTEDLADKAIEFITDATGTTNELQFFNNAPESLEESLARIDELGGPTTFNHYPWGWTFAGNTPFRRWKRETYRGGTSDPFLVHWPAGIGSRGAVRTQFAHIVDIVPTVLDALGLTPPATIRGVTQSPLHGVSFAHTFDDPAAASRHRTQYYEMFGHRAIDHDGWRAVCPWPGPSFAEAGKGFGALISAETLTDLDARHWELYDVAADPAENHDLAEKHRDKLIELIAMWYTEAGKYGVLPVDGSAAERLLAQRPQVAEPRNRFTYRPGTQTVGNFVGPRLLNRPHAITADAEIPADGAEGVLLCQGSSSGGWSLYVKDGRLCYAHNYLSRATYQVSAPQTLPAGRHELRFEFEPTGAPDFARGQGSPGRAQLYVDRRLIAQNEFPVTTPIGFNPGGLTCGANPGSAITADYVAPFPFTGTLHTVTVDVSDELITDTSSEMRMAMARQ